jgi:3-phytase
VRRGRRAPRRRGSFRRSKAGRGRTAWTSVRGPGGRGRLADSHPGQQVRSPKLFDRVREFGQRYTRTPGEEEGEFECEVDETSPSSGNPDLFADSEGLTIYRYGRSKGYLLATSQGSSTFIVYDLNSLTQLRTFAIGSGSADTVDDSDGAMVVGLPLGPTFAEGLLVTHDGDDEPFDDATNVKFTRWVDVARPLGLEVDTVSGDPRE